MPSIDAVDDEGKPFELSPDPLNAEMTAQLSGVSAENASGKLKPILSNAHIFGVDLYEAGIGGKIEEMFTEMLGGNGTVRATLKKYLA